MQESSQHHYSSLPTDNFAITLIFRQYMRGIFAAALKSLVHTPIQLMRASESFLLIHHKQI